MPRGRPTCSRWHPTSWMSASCASMRAMPDTCFGSGVRRLPISAPTWRRRAAGGHDGRSVPRAAGDGASDPLFELGTGLRALRQGQRTGPLRSRLAGHEGGACAVQRAAPTDVDLVAHGVQREHMRAPRHAHQIDRARSGPSGRGADLAAPGPVVRASRRKRRRREWPTRGAADVLGLWSCTCTCSFCGAFVRLGSAPRASGASRSRAHLSVDLASSLAHPEGGVGLGHLRPAHA